MNKDIEMKSVLVFIKTPPRSVFFFFTAVYLVKHCYEIEQKEKRSCDYNWVKVECYYWALLRFEKKGYLTQIDTFVDRKLTT